MALWAFSALALWALLPCFDFWPPRCGAFVTPDDTAVASTAAPEKKLLRERRQIPVSCNTTIYTEGRFASPGTDVPMMCYWYLIPAVGKNASVQFLSMDFGPCKYDSYGFPLDYVCMWRYLSLRGPFCGSSMSPNLTRNFPGKWIFIFKTTGTTGMKTSAFTAAFGSTNENVCTYSNSYMALQGCDLNGATDIATVRFCCNLNGTLANTIVASELPASFSLTVNALAAGRTADYYFGVCFTAPKVICGIGFTYLAIGFGAGYKVRVGNWSITTLAVAPTDGALCVSRGPVTNANITERLPCQSVTTASCAVAVVPPTNNFGFAGFAVYSK